MKDFHQAKLRNVSTHTMNTARLHRSAAFRVQAALIPAKDHHCRRNGQKLFQTMCGFFLKVFSPRFLLGTLLFLCLTLGDAVVSRAQAAEIDLPQVQAAYFFNFIKFVTWPESPETPLVIRTYKSPVIAEALKNAPQKSIQNRPFEIKNVQIPQEFLQADAVFIPREHAPQIPEDIWKKLQADDALVVSDWDQILNKGGTIQLMTIDGKIRFAVNLRHTANLAISSKLLRLASDVQK
jgi:hypothetical protein